MQAEALGILEAALWGLAGGGAAALMSLSAATKVVLGGQGGDGMRWAGRRTMFTNAHCAALACTPADPHVPRCEGAGSPPGRWRAGCVRLVKAALVSGV
jgi:hypothetical protein